MRDDTITHDVKATLGPDLPYSDGTPNQLHSSHLSLDSVRVHANLYRFCDVARHWLTLDAGPNHLTLILTGRQLTDLHAMLGVYLQEISRAAGEPQQETNIDATKCTHCGEPIDQHTDAERAGCSGQTVPTACGAGHHCTGRTDPDQL